MVVPNVTQGAIALDARLCTMNLRLLAAGVALSLGFCVAWLLPVPAALAQGAAAPVTVFVFAADESSGNRPIETNLPDWAPAGLRFFFDARDARAVLDEFTTNLRKAVDRREVVFADTLGRSEVRLEIVATRHEVPRGQRRLDGAVRLVRLSLRSNSYTTDFLWGKVETAEDRDVRVDDYQAPKEIARWISDNLDRLRR